MNMRGPDPLSYEPIPYGYDPNTGIWYDDIDNGIDWEGIINLGINRGADVARIAVGGYPPGSVVYAPNYPTIPGTSPAPAPYPAPSALPAVQPSGGIQLSTTT